MQLISEGIALHSKSLYKSVQSTVLNSASYTGSFVSPGIDNNLIPLKTTTTYDTGTQDLKLEGKFKGLKQLRFMNQKQMLSFQENKLIQPRMLLRS